jgi:signal transduction histidine kinase
MTDATQKTEFAPAERAPVDEVRRQAMRLRQAPLSRQTLDAVPAIMMILNRQRQIVSANNLLTQRLGLLRPEDVLDLRPDEAFLYVHAAESEGSTCGAVKAVLSSQKGCPAVEECRIATEQGDGLDLRVWTTPLEAENELDTIFTVSDITDEKRRRAPERIYFHDVLNVASGLQGFSELLSQAGAGDSGEFRTVIHQLAASLIEENQAQRDLAAAETGELQVKPVSVSSLALFGELVEAYRRRPDFAGRDIRVAGDSADAALQTDRVLLRRVLGNLLKNALEASRAGDTVTLAARPSGDAVMFTVHNPTVMPEDVQLQMFQRSFSTKGTGWGLGTYSVKLVTERYLKGRVSFVSGPDLGTCFTVRVPLRIQETAAATLGRMS